MKTLGDRIQNPIGLKPTAEALAAAAEHQRTGAALAAVNTTGIPCGIYRFRTHDEANRHSEAALARAIAENQRERSAR